MDKLLANQWFWACCVTAVITLQTLLTIQHQPWLDEWQALQIALQSPSTAHLFENLRYEGHPPLWYFMLRIVAIFVPVAWVLPTVQLPIALAIQGILLFRLSLTRFERLLIACSFYVLIDYGTIARSLGLGVLLLLIAILFRRHKLAWVALALLPMADFLFGILSLVCLAIYGAEKRLSRPGLALWFAMGLAAAWSVRPAPDLIPAFWLNGIVLDSVVELMRFGTILLPLQMDGLQLVWNNSPPPLIALPAGIVFLYLGTTLLRREILAQALFLGFCALIFIFSVAVYPLAIRHASLAGLLLILLVARQRERGGSRTVPFLLWLAASAACGLTATAINFMRPFDTARQTAHFIERHGLQDAHWVSFPDSRAQGVSALLGIEFERLERNCTQSFIRWNYRSTVKRRIDLERELNRIAARAGGFHLLSDLELPIKRMQNPQGYRLLTHIPAGYDGQDFYLYHIRPDLPERGPRPPKCEPARLPLRVLPAS
ncbi:hypothetical protein FHS91_003940 [Sphingobium xanthum]|uniref:hypothetical protein n=1 Tax=Sphingobium xanthum TaxID=1387165 RepID=UPI001C8B2AB1|nr:hypothetical protein [Sphingobium xanthum]